MSSTLLQTIAAALNWNLRVTENFVSVSPAGLYGINPATTTGLTLGFYGGEFNGVSPTNGTVTVTASLTNYVVAHRTMGVVSASTGATNWGNAGTYMQLYLVVAGSGSMTTITDYRQAFGAAAASGVALSNINVFTKNQSVATLALTDGANIATDASLSNNFKVTLGGNRTLDNPSNLTEGMIVNWAIKQDGTGSRTLAYGSNFKFPGGTAPALSVGANAKDFMSCYYDGSVLLCNLNKAFA